MAFPSNRLAGRWFKPQVPMFAPEKLIVLAAQVPLLKGSRTNPELTAGKLVTGSTAPDVTARVVAGSRTVPAGITRFRASHLLPGWGVTLQSVSGPVWVIKSVMSV